METQSSGGPVGRIRPAPSTTVTIAVNVFEEREER